METLSVESFSYGWLVNQNPPLDIADDASFIEMDPNLSPSKRFLVHQDFDFDLPTSQSPTNFVDADKLILNGILLPVNSYDAHSPATFNSIPVSPVSSITQRDVPLYRKSRSLSLRRCNRLPKRIIQKYMDLVRPLWCRMRRGRSDSSRVQGVENWEGSTASAPRRSEACWADHRRRSCDSESSIHEAVVHCKKTIGMT
ncbi:probable membrane-associated kinase regulator 6 [Cynara cardunculus var. scolymus]|uniref:probable membrane-associated kinase regulator 6 n=1 Tax=Cynara cardunculus var. scolymus TaxID=59895 RepID=UPI000D626466|nr:probable membrane-associated kinase regulator 6 [Cynara cardunculus var. scolymus]